MNDRLGFDLTEYLEYSFGAFRRIENDPAFSTQQSKTSNRNWESAPLTVE